MRLIVKTGIIAVILLACVGAVSANLVSNGGFEYPPIAHPTGWDIFPDGLPGLDWDVQWANDGTSVAAGAAGITVANAEFQNVSAIFINPAELDQYAELDADWDGHAGSINGEKANVVISQSFVTTPGATYHVSYWQRCREADECDLQFDWIGASTISVQTSGIMGSWTQQNYDRTATGALTTISFTGLDAPDSIGVLFDDVVVVQKSSPPPVPEFPTIALPAALIVGMLGAVLFVQRYKEN